MGLITGLQPGVNETAPQQLSLNFCAELKASRAFSSAWVHDPARVPGLKLLFSAIRPRNYLKLFPDSVY